jgi:hypothetical protein
MTSTESATVEDVTPVGDALASWHAFFMAGHSMNVIIGIPANCLLLLAYSKFPELQSNTNLLIVSQSAADIGVLLITPIFNFLNYTNLGVALAARFKYICLLSIITGVVFSLWSSIINLLLLSLDRMVCIQFPFFYAREERRACEGCHCFAVHVHYISSLCASAWLQHLQL